MRNTNTPVSFRLTGTYIPKALIVLLDAMFPDCLHIDDADDELVPVESTEWYKDTMAGMTPAKALKIMRTNAGLSQVCLASRLGMSKQNYNALEKGRNPISLRTAKKLAEALNTSYTMFYKE